MQSKNPPPHAAGAVAQLEWMRAQPSGSWDPPVPQQPEYAGFGHTTIAGWT